MFYIDHVNYSFYFIPGLGNENQLNHLPLKNDDSISDNNNVYKETTTFT